MTSPALSHPLPTYRDTATRRAAAAANAVLLVPALVTFLAHLLVAWNYGYFRDELYDIDAGRHLSLGYVDFPLFTALLAALAGHTLGYAPVALHVAPALAGALVVLLTGLIARELGGGRFAQGLAATAALTADIFLAIDSIFSMDPWDELWWVLGAYIVVRLLKRGEPRLWFLFGLVAGLGLLTKLTFLSFGAALTVGLLLTPTRAHLRTRWPWLAAGIALVGLLPYVLWNAANGWPTIAFWSHYGQHADRVSPVGFFLQQAILMNALTLPLWLAGLYYYLFTRDGRRYRPVGVAFVTLYVAFTLTHAKVYFLAPAYPPLFAAGALVVERRLATRPWRLLRLPYAALLVLVGLLLVPFAMPVLPPATYARYYGFLKGGGSGTTLPQWLADRFGWSAMTAAVAHVYDGLPAAERARACILTVNYGEAGALNFFGPAYHLPRAISGHNTYYLWGPGACNGATVIAIGYPGWYLQRSFGVVTAAARRTCASCMPEEANVVVYVCHRPRSAFKDLWPGFKHYD